VSIVATKLRNGSGAKGTQEGRDVVIDIRQNRLFPLSRGTNTSRDIYAPPWEWVEASVWTPRMLAALENGVRGGKWHSLIDKVYALPNLYAAWAEVKANQGAAGVDHVTIEDYEADLDANLNKLAAQLRDGRYVPQAVRRVWIPKPGSREGRPLGIPMVRSHCTSIQWTLGLLGNADQVTTAATLSQFDYCDAEELRDQRRRTGLRNSAMISGVSLIHRGLLGVARMLSKRPSRHQSAIVETSTFRMLAAALAE